MYNTCMIPSGDGSESMKPQEFVRQNRIPFANRKTIKNCTSCCQCGYAKAAALAALPKDENKHITAIKNQ